MIEVIDLHKSFDDQIVLNGINLKIPEGKICALIGGSGKGKSVLLKHLMGLMRPDSGKILINSKDISRLRGNDLTALKNRIGYVFQLGALFDSLTVFENVAFPLREKTKMKADQIKELVMKELKNIGLEGAENKYPAQISGGMKKRVALARCLIMNPDIILFDEPTTGLDPLITKSIHKLIQSLQKKRNLTALIVSHEIPEIFDIVDQVAMLHNGKILTSGTPQEFTNSPEPIVQQFLHGELE